MGNLEESSVFDAEGYKFWYIIDELKKDYAKFVYDGFPDEVIAGAIQGIRNLKEVSIKVKELEQISEEETKKLKTSILIEHCGHMYLMHLIVGVEHRYRFFDLYNRLMINEES